MNAKRYIRVARTGDSSGARFMAAAFVGGVVVGALAWSTQMQRSRRDLFGASPVGRLAALGYLAGHPGMEACRLLQEYVSWEDEPALRRRGEKLLRRMQRYLD